MAKPQGTAYQFKKGLGMKTTQSEKKEYYYKLRRSLVRSMKYYENKGIILDWFELPKIPKRITDGSIRKLENITEEWKYYTGRPADISRLPERVSKTGKDYYKNLRVQVESVKRQRDYLKELDSSKSVDEILEKNKDNPWLEKALNEGYVLSDLPKSSTNKLAKLYELCYLSISKASQVNKKAKSEHRSVQHIYSNAVVRRASIAIESFNDHGGDDPSEKPRIENNLSISRFEDLYQDLYDYIWASEQDIDLLYNILDVMDMNNDDNFEKKKFRGNYNPFDYA